MAPEAYLIHDAYGRTRLRVPARRRDDGYFSAVAGRLAGVPGVRQVQTNPLTGSIVVFHGGDLRPIAEQGRQLGLFRLAEPSESGLLLLGRRVRDLNRRLHRFSRGETDLVTLAVLGLGAAAALQAVRGNLLPPATSLLSQALNLLASSTAPS